MKQVMAVAAKWYSIPLLLLIWQLVVVSSLVNSRLLPGVGDVLSAFAADVANGELPQQAAITLGRALAGFSMAVIVGAALAAAMSSSDLFSRLFDPIFFLGYPIPKIALFPVFAFVFGVGSPSKVAFTFLECLYPIVISTYLGIMAIQSKLIWSAQNMGAGRLTIFLRVIVPAALPSIFAGLRIALPLALTVVVVTEMIGDTQGLGYYITVWSTRFQYAHVYAGILTVGICGLMLDSVIIQSRRWLLPWRQEIEAPSL
jgi:NitT/TauT family transport system permease protein